MGPSRRGKLPHPRWRIVVLLVEAGPARLAIQSVVYSSTAPPWRFRHFITGWYIKRCCAASMTFYTAW